MMRDHLLLRDDTASSDPLRPQTRDRAFHANLFKRNRQAHVRRLSFRRRTRVEFALDSIDYKQRTQLATFAAREIGSASRKLRSDQLTTDVLEPHSR